MNRRALIPIVLVVALGAGMGWWALGRSATAASQQTFSGTIDADEVDITSEVSGKVARLLVDDGVPVNAGATLIALNTDLLDAQLAQARAAAQAAAANLALLKAGSREEEIAQAQAALAQAQAQRDGAERAWQNAQASTIVTQAQVLADGASRAYADALRNLTNPQEVDSQVVQAQTARDSTAAALAQAQVNAQAARDRLSAVKTQAEVQVRQSADALTQAQAAYARSQSNWHYVQERGDDPIQPKICTQAGCKANKLSDAQRNGYYTQYIQAEAAMHQAEQAVQQALVAAEAARQAEVAGVQTADEQVRAAQTGLDNAQRTLEQMKAIRANPQQLRVAADAALAQRNTAIAGIAAARVQQQTAVDNASAQLQAAEAQLAQAQARLDLAQAGARAEQIQAAEAQLAQARAQEQQIEIQIHKATIPAPVDGVVLERVINLGEQATPGNILLKISSLATVKLTIYVPEDEIGPFQLRQGVHVQVQVDSFPARIFDGTITYIAPLTEFTPRNVQTKAERATTVFPVRIELANPDGALKPGMPADATVTR